MALPTPKESSAFKWVCLLVAVVALAGFGWMANDVRLKVDALVLKVEKLTDKAEVLASKAEVLADKAEKATITVNEEVPPLIVRADAGLEEVMGLTASFNQYKGLLGAVHAARRNPGLFSYGASLLSWVGGQNATIGTKKLAPEKGLKREVPASEWAKSAEKDAHFLSLFAKSKEDMLHGLARTGSAAPLQVRIGDRPPVPLADWVREKHPESKDVGGPEGTKPPKDKAGPKVGSARSVRRPAWLS